jgi:type II secretory pathway component PulJ
MKKVLLAAVFFASVAPAMAGSLTDAANEHGRCAAAYRETAKMRDDMRPLGRRREELEGSGKACSSENVSLLREWKSRLRASIR